MSAEDRTSELPEVILHHIQSYLPIKDAASTSVLSKWWNKAWETLPYLNFNDESFMIKSPYPEEWKRVGKHAKLLAAVQRIVQRRQHISIQKFSLLVLPWKDKHLRRLPEEDVEERNREIGLSSFGVIDYVATPFLRELELVNDITASWNLLLPPSLVSARCLTSLNLYGFNLSSSWSSSSLDINLPCLQKLILTNVVVNDSILEALIFGSRSSLETLQLEGCFGFSTIHLVGEFVKFKRLSVELTGIVMLEVSDAPEFEDLRLHDCYMLRELLCCYFNIKNCPRLRKIFLDCNFVTQNNLASFENLEYCSVLNNINISSNSLKTLSLSSMNNLTHLHISSPTLESLTFDLKIIPNLSLNVSTERLRVINLFVTPFDLKWIKFLQYFKRTKIVTIKCWEVVITPAYMSDEPELLSPLHGTRNIF